MHLATTDEARCKSRLVGIRVSMLMLRLRDNWQRVFDDYEAALLVLAIVVIKSERLTRGKVEPSLHDLGVSIPGDRLTKCNVSSLASATGLNRETARRKVLQLERSGILIRAENGIELADGFTQQAEILETVRLQLEQVRRAANDLIRIGALAIER